MLYAPVLIAPLNIAKSLNNVKVYRAVMKLTCSSHSKIH
jgi:hypothetical protein